MKPFKYLIWVLLYACFARCSNPKHVKIQRSQLATKFNGKVVNNIYYDDAFKYKIKIPVGWLLFNSSDFSKGVTIPNNYFTFLVGFKSTDHETIYFYDVDLANYNDSYPSLIQDYSQQLRRQLLVLVRGESNVLTIYDNYKTGNCFDEFRIDLPDTTPGNLLLSQAVAFKPINKNHAIMGISLITSKGDLLVLKNTLDYICKEN